MSINFVENNNKLTDEEIITAINDGDYRLISAIIDRYLPLIICLT